MHSRLIRRLMVVAAAAVAPAAVLLGMIAAAAGAAPATAAWTVMVYMSGDNDLERWVVRDLEQELAAVGSTDAVQVVALADRGPGRDRSRGNWTGVQLFHVTKGMRAEPANAAAGWGERNLGNPQTLIDFVDWTRANYPAEKYALVFWGHGWSWHKGYSMHDWTSNDALEAGELRRAFDRLGRFDVVAYDACNVGAIETQALWRDNAAAIAHSQEWVDVTGMEYDRVLAALNADPAMPPDELAVAFARSAPDDIERTWSAVALDGRWDALERAVDAWSLALLAGLPEHEAAYDRALKQTQRFADAPMDRDLADLAAAIAAEVDDPAIDAAGAAVVAAVDAAVLTEWHRADYEGANGITIFVPRHAKGRAFGVYRNLGFAENTHWDEFLRAWRP